MSAATIAGALTSAHDAALVAELMDAYTEAKREYFAGGLRLSEVEGGRFCEAAFRILQESTTGTFTPLGASLNTMGIIDALAKLSGANFSSSVRLHIPRALRVVYDIRNNRDAAHLADGIDPNQQDATLVVSVLDWVMAEFVRLYHPGMTPDEAQDIVVELVTRQAPVIEDFDGYLKVLRTDLGASQMCLALLYQRGTVGATFDEMLEWSRPPMRANLKRTLMALVDSKAFVHFDGHRFLITATGRQEADKTGILLPA